MKRLGPLLFVVIALTLVTLIGRGAVTTPVPLDPDSTAKDGTRALVEIVDSYGMAVEVGGPEMLAEISDPQAATVLVLRDVIENDADAELLHELVAAGADVVSVDQFTQVLERAIVLESTGETQRGVCTIAELDDVESLERDRFYRYTPAPTDEVCFSFEGGAAVLRHHNGAGSITLIPGPSMLTNEYLGSRDNAVLAVRLIDPQPGTKLYIVYDYGFGADTSSRDSLWSLVSTPARWFGVQLLVAAGLFSLWQARRFGAVVQEPQLVKIPASRMVRAAGEIRRRSGHHTQVKRRVARDFEARLRQYYHLPLGLQAGEVAAAVSPGDQVVAQRVAAALSEQVVPTDTELVAAIQEVDELSRHLMPGADTEQHLQKQGTS